MKAGALFRLPALGMLAMIPAIAASQGEDPGWLLYHRGRTSASASAAVAGGIEVPPEAYPCRACHGEDGRGGREGGVVIPSLRRRVLTTPVPEGRPAYTRRTLVRAITDGIDAGGREMNLLMPRYRLRERDLRSLLDYLQQLDRTDTPGVGPKTLRIGTLIPAEGSAALLGKVIVGVLRAYFDRVNERGGIYGRNLTLVVHSGDTVPPSLGQTLLCLLSPLLVDGDSADEAIPEDLPRLFPLGGDHPSPSGLRLTATMNEQAESLVSWWLAGRKDRGRVWLVTQPRDTLLRESIRSRMAAAGVTAELLEAGAPEFAGRIGRGLKKTGGVLFWFAAPARLTALVETLKSHARGIEMYAPIDLTARHLDALSQAGVRLVVTDPRGRAETDSSAFAEFAALRQSLPADIRGHGELVRYAYTAAALLEEGLKQAGRRLTRRSLQERLERIHGFHSGAMPPVSLAPHLVRPSTILVYSPRTRRFEVASEWSKPGDAVQ